MAETEGAEGAQGLETPAEELDETEKAMQFFSKYAEARRALPWEQWTFREKAGYYMDRFFIAFIVIFLLVMVGDIGYKIWYVTNMKKIAEFVSDTAVLLFSWLFTQERQEERLEF